MASLPIVSEGEAPHTPLPMATTLILYLSRADGKVLTARQYLRSGRATLVQLQFSGIMASSLQLIASAYGRGALLSAETGILSAPILV